MAALREAWCVLPRKPFSFDCETNSIGLVFGATGPPSSHGPDGWRSRWSWRPGRCSGRHGTSRLTSSRRPAADLPPKSCFCNRTLPSSWLTCRLRAAARARPRRTRTTTTRSRPRRPTRRRSTSSTRSRRPADNGNRFDNIPSNFDEMHSLYLLSGWSRHALRSGVRHLT